MPGGVEGGMVGGVPGGVIGGVIGGTGTGPVPVVDYDRPPRALRTPRPDYPPEAFVKKVEGTVMLEILIDATGRVAGVRVAQSIPLLDKAAVDVVRTWRFEPAVKHGRPVASLAFAPVTFRIY
jgi:protein TonB